MEKVLDDDKIPALEHEIESLKSSKENSEGKAEKLNNQIHSLETELKECVEKKKLSSKNFRKKFQLYMKKTAQLETNLAFAQERSA